VQLNDFEFEAEAAAAPCRQSLLNGRRVISYGSTSSRQVVYRSRSQRTDVDCRKAAGFSSSLV